MDTPAGRDPGRESARRGCCRALAAALEGAILGPVDGSCLQAAVIGQAHPVARGGGMPSSR